MISKKQFNDGGIIQTNFPEALELTNWVIGEDCCYTGSCYGFPYLLIATQTGSFPLNHFLFFIDLFGDNDRIIDKHP